jgi:hypothetical protein
MPTQRFGINLVLVALFILGGGTARARTLQEAYEIAGPQGEYDKYVVLETGAVYTGGLMIGPSLLPYSDQLVGGRGYDVRIVGNGAILDLQGQQLCISYCENSLDVEDCIVVNGNIRFRGLTNATVDLFPTGSVRYVTFYEPHDYGVRLQRCGDDILVERNLVVSAVDTGSDFIYSNGISSDWMPTGTNISAGWAAGWPIMRENWSYHINPKDNADPLHHFSFL